MRPRDLVANTTIVVVTAIGLAGLVWFLIQILDILIIVLIAAILSAGLSPLVGTLQTWRTTRRGRQLTRAEAILVVYVGALIVVGMLISVVVTPLVSESRGFIEHLPTIMADLRATITGFEQRYPWLPDLTAILDRLPAQVSNIGRYGGVAAGVAVRFLGGVGTLVTVLVLTFYMLLEGGRMKVEFLALVPAASRSRLDGLLSGIEQKFGGWVRGQLLLGFIIGLAALIGTWILGLPYPLLLGLVAGFTELIPIVGPILGAIPAVLVAIFQPPWWRTAAVIGFYVFIQQTEAHVVVPRVMRRAVGLSPLLTIIALLIGAKLLGILGVLLSVPVAAALQVVVGEVVDTLQKARPGK